MSFTQFINFFLAATEADRFYDNIEAMIGIRIIPWFRWCWKWFTPAVTVATFTFYLVTHRALKYNKTYEYPAWGIALGWSLAMVSIVMLPISMAYVWWSTPNMPNVSKHNCMGSIPEPF